MFDFLRSFQPLISITTAVGLNSFTRSLSVAASAICTAAIRTWPELEEATGATGDESAGAATSVEVEAIAVSSTDIGDGNVDDASTVDASVDVCVGVCGCDCDCGATAGVDTGIDICVGGDTAGVDVGTCAGVVVAATTPAEFSAPGVPPGSALVCHPTPSAFRSIVTFVTLSPAGQPLDASR